MDPIVSCAEQTLRGSAHPALLLSELLEAVAERVDRGLDAARLRGMLEAHPERFRILEPWRGVAQAGAGGLLAREGTGDAGSWRSRLRMFPRMETRRRPSASEKA